MGNNKLIATGSVVKAAQAGKGTFYEAQIGSGREIKVIGRYSTREEAEQALAKAKELRNRKFRGGCVAKLTDKNEWVARINTESGYEVLGHFATKEEAEQKLQATIKLMSRE